MKDMKPSTSNSIVGAPNPFNRRLRTGLAVFLLATLSLTALSAQATTYKDLVLADGPRYYWNWDDGSFGGVDMISDNLGAGDAGQLYGSKTWGSATTIGTSNANGLSLGNAASFPGTIYDNWYTWAPGSAMNDGIYTDWAVEFWMNADSTMTGEAVIGNLFDNGSFYFTYVPSTTKLKLMGVEMQAVSMDAWHHVLLAKYGSVGTCIIDGSVAGETTTAITAVFDASNVSFMRIGSWAGYANLFKGKIDEFAIYDLTDLSPAQYDAKLESIASHVPEPSLAALAAVGAGLLVWRRHQRG